MSKTYNLLCPKCGYTMKFTQLILDKYDEINPSEFQCPECCEMIKNWREKLVFVDTEEIERKKKWNMKDQTLVDVSIFQDIHL